MKTTGPYTYDLQVMDTEEGKTFINLYHIMNEFNLKNCPNSCEATLNLMAVFLRENINNGTLVNECLNYLGDMPGDWIKYLVLHLL